VDIKQKYPHIHCIAITYLQSGRTIETSLKAGITSYIKKDCEGAEIIAAVKKTIEGQRFFCKDILFTIEQDAIAVDQITFSPRDLDQMIISPREKDIVCMIADGLTNIEIADKLFLSTHTVNTHRRNIMSKLGVNNTAGIVMYAIKANLIQPNKFLFSHQRD
jgi:DNA-binding NarL/FixJ family response regulator